jgi:hypothetical protein
VADNPVYLTKSRKGKATRPAASFASINAAAAPLRLIFSVFRVIILFARRSVKRFVLQTLYGIRPVTPNREVSKRESTEKKLSKHHSKPSSRFTRMAGQKNWPVAGDNGRRPAILVRLGPFGKIGAAFQPILVERPKPIVN